MGFRPIRAHREDLALRTAVLAKLPRNQAFRSLAEDPDGIPAALAFFEKPARPEVRPAE